MANPYGGGGGSTVDTIFGGDDPYQAALKKLNQPTQVYGNNQTAAADFSGINNNYAGQDPSAAAASINNMASPTTNPYAPQTIKSDTSAIDKAMAGNTGTYAPQNATATTVNRTALNTTTPTLATDTTSFDKSNADVLQALQNKAITGNQSAIDPLLQQKSTDLLNNPYLGYDFAANKQKQLEGEDQSRAQALEDLRRKSGSTLDTGDTRSMLLDQALKGNTERANLENTINQQNFQTQLNAYNNSLEQGRQTSKNASDILASGVQNLATARGAAQAQASQNYDALKTDAENKVKLAMQSNDIASSQDAIDAQIAAAKQAATEGYAFNAQQSSINRALEAAKYVTDIGVQKDMLNLQASINRGDLIAKADIDKQMAAIETAKATALQNGDVQGKMALDTLSAQLQSVQTAAQENYQTAERMATQHFQGDQAMTQAQITLAGQYLDAKTKEALQKNDADMTKWVETQKEQHDIDVQLNGFSHDRKMTNLNARIATAKANGDVTRAEKLAKYQDNLKLNDDLVKNGYDVAMKNLDASIADARANGDFAHATSLQNDKIAANATEHDKDLAISQAEIALKKQGLDYTQIQAAVEAGVADPKTLATWLGQHGVDTTAPDPYAAQKAQQQKADLMFDGWASSHPDKVIPATDANGQAIPGKYQLKDPKDTTYNDFVNQSLYNEKTGQSASSKLAQATPSDLQGADQPGSKYYQDYQDALKVATPFENKSTREGGSGLWQNHTDKFSNPIPSIGVSFKGEGGKLYIATSGIDTDKNDGNGTEYFYALDPATGNTMKISAANQGGYTTWQSVAESMGVTTGTKAGDKALGGSGSGALF